MSNYAYAGKCRKCGALCAAVVDDPDCKKEAAEAVSEFIMIGLEVSRMTVEDVQAKFDSCKCKKQPTLFDEVKP